METVIFTRNLLGGADTTFDTEPRCVLHSTAGYRIRRFARCLFYKCHDFRTDRKVRLLAETVLAQSALAIDEDERWCSVHLIGMHGVGNRPLPGGTIHTDRKSNAVLAQKSFQRYRRHRLVMLEHGVKTDHLDGV